MKITTPIQGKIGQSIICKISPPIIEPIKVKLKGGTKAFVLQTLFGDYEIAPINPKDAIPQLENEEVEVL
jgi:hypothetical protein